MNLFVIFSPHVLFLLGAVLLTIVFSPFILIAGGVLAILMYTDWKSQNHTLEHRTILGMGRHRMTTVLTILCAALFFAVYSMAFVSCSGPCFLKARTTKNWRELARGTDTAIVLGFGLERDERGRRAGNANRFLYEWTVKNTGARTLLVQEGIRLAAEEIASAGPALVLIHPHDDDRYVDTLQAARFALQKLAALGKSQAVLVAHDLQLRRAYWDLIKVRRTRPEWRRIEIIVPRIPQTPFPRASVQWHTRGGYRYRFVEMFWSRPRDYLASAKKLP